MRRTLRATPPSRWRGGGKVRVTGVAGGGTDNDAGILNIPNDLINKKRPWRVTVVLVQF